MASIGEMFGKKKGGPPKFGGEGPPQGTDEPRGMGGGGEGPEAGPDDGSPGAADYNSAHELALDDLADILGVSPEDRSDLSSALKAYVQSCIADTLGGGPSDEAPSPEPDSDEGGAPSPEK